MMKKIIILLCCIMLCLAGCGEETPKEEIVATIVNGQEITQAEIDNRTEVLKRYYQLKFNVDFYSEKGKKTLETLKEKAIEQLINEKLFMQEAEKRKITISDKEIDKAVEEWRAGFDNQYEADEFMQMNHVKSEELRAQKKYEIMIEKLKKAVFAEGKVEPTTSECKAYYQKHEEEYKYPEMVWARHILFAKEDKAKAEEILAKVKKEDLFEEYAREYSIDKGSAVRGGDLGYFSRGQMVKPFEDLAFSLKKGEIGGLVESKFGYHIIKIVDHKQPGQLSFEDAEDEIKKILLAAKVQKCWEDFKKDIHDKADIKEGK